MTTPNLPTCTRDGITIFKRYPGAESAYYHKFTHQRRQHMLKLLPTAEESFALAKKMRKAILAGRFEALDAVRERRAHSTLGELFARYQANARGCTGISDTTVRNNLSCVRVIFRHVQGGTDPERPGYLTDDAIAAKSTSELNPALLEKYKAALLSAAGTDRVAQDRSSITANSTIRGARCLFSKKLPRDFYAGIVLPDLAALRDVRALPEPTKGYTMPTPEELQRIRAAAPALRQLDTNAYLIYLLGLGAGLRAGEIAACRHHWIESHVVNGRAVDVIRVQVETDFRPKGKAERLVPIGADILSEIRAVSPMPAPELVRLNQDYLLSGSMTERTDTAFRRVSAWLRGLGWTRLKKAHEFRKMFGSYVASQAGLRAAQESLGHANASTTDRYYAGQVNLPSYTIPALK